MPAVKSALTVATELLPRKFIWSILLPPTTPLNTTCLPALMFITPSFLPSLSIVPPNVALTSIVNSEPPLPEPRVILPSPEKSPAA